MFQSCHVMEASGAWHEQPGMLLTDCDNQKRVLGSPIAGQRADRAIDPRRQDRARPPGQKGNVDRAPRGDGARGWAEGAPAACLSGSGCSPGSHMARPMDFFSPRRRTRRGSNVPIRPVRLVARATGRGRAGDGISKAPIESNKMMLGPLRPWGPGRTPIRPGPLSSGLTAALSASTPAPCAAPRRQSHHPVRPLVEPHVRQKPPSKGDGFATSGAALGLRNSSLEAEEPAVPAAA